MSVEDIDASGHREFDNHARVVRISDPDSGLVAFVSIHRKHNGHPSLGATRFWKYKSEDHALRDALRLSQLMSDKSVCAGFEYGGAKAVIMDNGYEDRDAVLSAYARAVEELGGLFVTGSDVGVTDEDLDLMKQHTNHIIGKGIDSGYYTALGVFYAMQTLLEKIHGDSEISGRTFAVQGLGSTGMNLLKLLLDAGASRVFVSDIDEGKLQAAVGLSDAVSGVSHTEIHAQDVDIFAPCALAHTVSRHTVDSIGAKAIVGAANNQLKNSTVARALFDKGVLYAPDYIVNAGGIMSVADEFTYGEFDKRRVKESIHNIKSRVSSFF